MIHSSSVTTKRRTSGPRLLEIEHDISNPLARAVIGQLTSAAGFVHRKTRIDHVGRIRTGAGGVERRVLEQPDEFGSPSCGDRGGPGFHFGDGIVIGDGGIARRHSTGVDPTAIGSPTFNVFRSLTTHSPYHDDLSVTLP